MTPRREVRRRPAPSAMYPPPARAHFGSEQQLLCPSRPSSDRDGVRIRRCHESWTRGFDNDLVASDGYAEVVRFLPPLTKRELDAVVNDALEEPRAVRQAVTVGH